MKLPLKRYLLIFIFICALISMLASCVSTGSTKPNTPFSGNPYPEILKELSEKNQLLANELGKLPEFQDGISNPEIKALTELVSIYNKNQEAFDKAFDQMYQVGIPEARKYCSPLQALYWLIEDEQFENAENILQKYNLDRLLTIAWPSENNVFSDTDITEILNGINDKKIKERLLYLYSLEGREKVRPDISIYRRTNPEIFSENAKRIINKFKNPPRKIKKEAWQDFNAVVDRLNAPELINYYINHSFSYEFDPGKTKRSKTIFQLKKGDCDDVAYFGEQALKRGGYKTFHVRVQKSSNEKDAHIGSGIIDKFDKYFLVVDFDNFRLNRMSGPFDNKRDVCSKLADGKPIFKCSTSDAYWF
jgi:hypothetical protein